MEEAANAIKKALKSIGKTVTKIVLPPILIVTIIIVLITGATYMVMKWIAKAVNEVSTEFTTNVTIDESGVASSGMSAKEMWDEMGKKGYDVDKYLKNPKELQRLLNAELVTQLPDTRKDVTKSVDWDAIYKEKPNASNRKINVLFVGNSKTYTNELPTQFQKLAESLGNEVNAERTSNAWGGRTLNDFMEEDGPSNDLKNKVKEKKWDFIVLQEQTDASLSSTQLTESASSIIQYVRENSNEDVIPIFAAWSVLGDFDEASYNKAIGNYEAAQAQNGGDVAYIARALIECHKQYPEITFFQDDNLHPTMEGTYLAACCIYGAIYETETKGAKFKAGISEEDGTHIQEISDEVQKNNMSNKVQGIVKFKRHDSDGNTYYMTYVEPEVFYGWQEAYNLTSDSSARQSAMENISKHYTLVKKPGSANNTNLSNEKASNVGEKVVEYVKSKLGCPYVWATAGPDTFDCSGLTSAAYASAGITISRNDQEQHDDPQFEQIPISEAQPGDILWHSGHVGIYIGNDEFIHAPKPGDVVSQVAMQYGGWTCALHLKASDNTSSEKDKEKEKDKKESDKKKSDTNNVQPGFTQIYPDIDQTGYSQVYTSSTGRTYKDFKQIPPAPYAGQPYNGSTIGSYGCGITSAAIVLSSFAGCEDIDPSVTGSQMSYTSDTGFFASRGISAESIEGDFSAEEIANFLKDGKVLVAGYRGNPAIYRRSTLCCNCRYGF